MHFRIILLYAYSDYIGLGFRVQVIINLHLKTLYMVWKMENLVLFIGLKEMHLKLYKFPPGSM